MKFKNNFAEIRVYELKLNLLQSKPTRKFIYCKSANYNSVHEYDERFLDFLLKRYKFYV